MSSNKDNLQKPNVYNTFLPFYDTIKQQSLESFEEICENLSRIIQLRELRPGFPLWSSKLQQFISLYGFSFTKSDHLKLIHLYLSVLTIPDLNYSNAKTSFDIIDELLTKSRLITRDDLIIDWHLLYIWIKLILFNNDESYSLVALPNDIEKSLLYCVRSCRPYLSATATQEILDEFRPWLCPFDSAFSDAMCYLDLLLPVHLPPNLHEQGFKLWLQELLGIWESVTNSPDWEQNVINIFSFVAWCNIGYVDWEPWLPKIFTRILKNFSLPVANVQVSTQSQSYSLTIISTWLVAMMGNGSSCLQYLKDLFTATKTFYHPSNTGDFQQDLVSFLSKLSQAFIDRVHLERKPDCAWHFNPPKSYRLTEDDITDFVNCVKECVFISVFNKAHLEEAAKACHCLSQLRPELVVPPLVELLFLSIDSITEPHRFTAVITCLAGMTREIVRQTPRFSQGQTYVLPLLMSFLNAILMLVTCVDCSSAVHTRNDLTEIEKEVCLSTAKFEDFISEFLNRTFRMIETLSTEMSDAVMLTNESNLEDQEAGQELTNMIAGIVQQCSDKIFQMIREKITNFLAASSFSPKISKLLNGLVRAILKGKPEETLKCLLPQTCERINKIITQSDSLVLTDHKGDTELTWCLTLFSELVRARGDALLIYKQMIFSVFHQCIRIIHKESYETVANAAKNLLKSLSYVYPNEYRLTTENIEEPFTDFLPIRAWGQHVELDDLQVQFHVPNAEEVDFACEFVETFIYPELQLLNEKCSKMSNDERLRSLTLIRFMAIGCFRMVPRIDSPEVTNLVLSVVPFDTRKRAKYTLYAKEPNFKENLRIRLLTDIGNLLDVLVENHSDDASSMKTALKIYSITSVFFGVFENYVEKLCKDLETSKLLFKNKLSGKRKHPRFIIIKRINVQLELFSISNYQSLTEIDKQVILKLFELSIHRYSEVRRNAQVYLFHILRRYLFSYQVIIDRILELLNSPDEADHDQIKGCLYILLGNDSIFIPTKHSWTLLEKLWPSLARTVHATKVSTQNLLDRIMEKIGKQFDTPAVTEDINDASVQAAISLWRPLEANELTFRDQLREERNQANIQSYNNVMETLNSLFYGNVLTWRQQEMTMAFIWLLLQRPIALPSSCIRTFVDFLVHDNVELRKISEKGIAAFTRLQKPPRIYIEKTLDQILHRPVNINECHPGDRDDNLWLTINNYKPPTSQQEWEETCFLDKSYHGYYKWPKIIRYPMNKRERYTKETMPENVSILYERFVDKDFISKFIQLMVLDEEEEEINFDIHRFRMFKGLFRNFGLVLIDTFMEHLYVLIHEKTKEKHEGSHRVAAEITGAMIRGSKHWTLDMLDELWKRLTPFLNEVCTNLSAETVTHWGSCFKFGMEDEDPRRMYRPVEFLRSLINTHATGNTFLATSQWTLVQKLSNFEWRIPEVWWAINQYAKDHLDHPYKAIRERIASVLTTSLSFDIKLPNSQSTRHPNVNQFIDNIRERFAQAIQIYEKTPLANISGERVEIDSEARKALNYIETVVQLHTLMFSSYIQPVKSSIIRLFPHLCEIDSIIANDDFIRESTVISRMYLAVTYLQIPFIEPLIEQLEYVCSSTKWHARRAAIEFVQNMIFSNLFNTRPYAQRLRQLVFKCLFDEQFEVRTVASVTLSGFYQCGFIQVSKDDLKHFRVMSKTSYFTKVDGKKVTSVENIVKRHGGVLGLCAIVLSSPYDIPDDVPEALMLLCEHSHDPDLIQKSIKKSLSEFRRTHYDSWHEHREKFTEDQLVILADMDKKKKRQLIQNREDFITQLYQECVSIKEITKWSQFEPIYEKLQKVIDVEKELLKSNPISNREERLYDFNKWLHSNGIDTSNFTICSFENYGFGLKATKPLCTNECFLNVPLSLTITTDTIKSSSSLASLVTNDQLLRSMPNVALALFLLHERSESKWKPYIDVLPNQFNTPLYFDLDQLNRLKSSAILCDVLMHIQRIARQYCYLHNLLKGQLSLSKLSENFSFDTYRWAVSVVSTRQNNVSNEQGEPRLGLIPVMDFLNHQNGQECIHYDENLKQIECKTMKDIEKDEQIFMFYGKRTNAEYLIHNGFVPDQNNPYDTYSLRLALPKTDKGFDEKSQLLQRYGLETSDKFLLFVENELLNLTIFIFIKIFLMNSDEITKVLAENMTMDNFFDHYALDKDNDVRTFLKTRLQLLIRSLNIKFLTNNDFINSLILSEYNLLANAYKKLELPF
ncbi:hypothetical protein I4U23_028569 [Adineta vaga]|nr:hypothetical protein I4U23_028569 [Adineta vaga]